VLPQVAEFWAQVKRQVMLLEYAWQHRVKKFRHPQHLLAHDIAGRSWLRRRRRSGNHQKKSGKSSKPGLSLNVRHEFH
jgi:hypothetical protein